MWQNYNVSLSKMFCFYYCHLCKTVELYAKQCAKANAKWKHENIKTYMGRPQTTLCFPGSNQCKLCASSIFWSTSFYSDSENNSIVIQCSVALTVGNMKVGCTPDSLRTQLLTSADDSLVSHRKRARVKWRHAEVSTWVYHTNRWQNKSFSAGVHSEICCFYITSEETLVGLRACLIFL